MMHGNNLVDHRQSNSIPIARVVWVYEQAAILKIETIYLSPVCDLYVFGQLRAERPFRVNFFKNG